MKRSIYAAAVALAAMIAYRSAAEADISTEEVVYWILSALIGGALAVWMYDRWRMRGRWSPRPYD